MALKREPIWNEDSPVILGWRTTERRKTLAVANAKGILVTTELAAEPGFSAAAGDVDEAIVTFR